MAQVIAFQIELNGISPAIRNTEQLTAAINSTREALRAATINSSERAQLGRELAALTSVQQQMTRQQRDATVAAGAATGSYRAMNLELGQLRTRYRDLSETDRSGAIGTNLQRQIQSLNGELVRLDAGIGNYQRNIGNYASAFQGLGGVFANVLGGLGIGFGIKELGELALQSESYARKSATVLGDSLGYVTEQAQNNAAAMGLTSKQYVAAATDLADLLIPMGFGRQEAAKFSTGLVDLSGALSEWTGGQKDAKQVADILQSAILGEREQLKGLGISISEADVKAQLAANGQDKLTGALLQQAQAQATYQLILAKSTDAQAAFANGADSPIRALAQFKAQIFTAIELLSVGLLNGLELIISALKGLANFLAENKTALIAAGLAVAAYAAALNNTKSALLLFEAAQAGNTLVTNAAAIAQKGLSLAMAAVPYVAVGVAVYALITAMQQWFGATEEQIKTQEVLLASQKELTDAYASEAQSAAELFAIAKSDVSSKEQKAAAVQRIIELYPNYLGGFRTETDILNNLDAVQKSVNKGILDGAIARVKAQKIQEATTALLDAQLKKEQLIFEANKRGIDLTTSIGSGLLAKADQQINDIKQRLADLPIFLSKVGESLSSQNIDFTGLSISDDQIKEVQRQLQEVSAIRFAYAQRYGKELEGEAKGRYDYLINEEKRLQIERQKLIDSNLKGEQVAAQKSVAITEQAEAKKDKAKGGKEGKTKEVETLETLQAKLIELQGKLSGLKDTPSKIPTSLFDDITKTKKEIDELTEKLRKAGLLPTAQNKDIPLEIKLDATDAKKGLAEYLAEKDKTNKEANDKQLADDMQTDKEMLELKRAADEKAAQDEINRRKETNQLLLNTALDLARGLSDTVFNIQKEANQKELENKVAELETAQQAELDLAGNNATLISAINERYAEQKKELDRKAFEENKRLAIAQALINGALAATAVFTVPDFTFGVASAIRLGFIAANTAIQVGAIAAQKFAKGGFVQGKGTGTSDEIPAMLSNGEFVVTADATKKIGVSNLNRMNETMSMPSISAPQSLRSNQGLSQADINAIVQGVKEGAYQGTQTGVNDGLVAVNRETNILNKLK